MEVSICFLPRELFPVRIDLPCFTLPLRAKKQPNISTMAPSMDVPKQQEAAVRQGKGESATAPVTKVC